MPKSLGLLLLALAGALAGCGPDKEIYQSSGAQLGEAFSGVVAPGFYDGPNGSVLVKNNAAGQTFILEAQGDDGAPVRCAAVVQDLARDADAFELSAAKKGAPCTLSVSDASAEGFTLEGKVAGAAHAASYTRRSEGDLARSYTSADGTLSIEKADDSGLRLRGTIKGRSFSNLVADLSQGEVEGEPTLRYIASSDPCYFWIATQRKDDKVSLAVNVVGLETCQERGTYVFE